MFLDTPPFFLKNDRIHQKWSIDEDGALDKMTLVGNCLGFGHDSGMENDEDKRHSKEVLLFPVHMRERM